MLGRSGYRPLPLGDFDRFQQSSLGFLGSQKGCLFPEPGGVQTEAGEWPPSTAEPGGTGRHPQARTLCPRSRLVLRSHSKRRDRGGRGAERGRDWALDASAERPFLGPWGSNCRALIV